MFNINYRLILKTIGVLFGIETLFLLLPLGVSLWYGDGDFPAFAITTAISIVLGCIAYFQYPNAEHRTFGKRDGFLIVTSSWLFFSVVGMLPYLISGSIDNVTDAFFETMSGVTTTGASVIPDIESLPHGVLLWRSMTQWLGGLGIILFTLAVMPLLNKGGGGVQLFAAETSGIMYDKIRPRISQTAKRLWTTYIGITALVAMLLFAGPMDGFDAVCHAMTTAATGGFSTKANGLMYWHSAYMEYVIIVFMLLSSINYSLVYWATQGKFKKMFDNEEVRWFLFIVTIATGLVAIGLFIIGTGETWGIERTLRTALFQVSAIISSTGFLTANYAEWGAFFCVIICLLMFCGGCAGSTSGGAKVIRIVVLMKNTVNEFYRQIHPNAIIPVRVNQQVISYEIVSKILAFLFIYAFLAIVSSLALSAMGLSIEESFGCSISCISNIGPALGGMVFSFGSIPAVGKWLLTFDMLVGRLEIFTVLILFTSYFWKK